MGGGGLRGWRGVGLGWAGAGSPGLAGAGGVSTEKMSFRMANSNKQFLFISFLRV